MQITEPPSEPRRRRNHRLHRPAASDRVTCSPKTTRRDLGLFQLLARLRVLDSEQLFHLAAAAGEPIGAVQHRRRLKQLFEHGYLDLPREQLRLWKPGEGSPKNLYALGQRGADVLLRSVARDTYAPRALPLGRLGGKWTTKNREIRADTLEHLLMVNRFYTALVRACCGTGISIDWRSEWEWPPGREERGHSDQSVFLDIARPVLRTKLHPSDAPRDATGQRPRQPLAIPINPDGFFTLSWKRRGKGRGGQGDERLAFFLEADRATEVVAGRRRSLLKRSLYRKYVGYWNWLANERGHKALGLDGFAVLTVTTSRERAVNFSAAAEAAVSRRAPRGALFWAAAETDYLATAERPEQFRRLFSPIWFSEKGAPAEHHPFEHAPLGHFDRLTPGGVK